MRRDLGKTLAVPTVLAVAVLGCGDDKPSPTTQTTTQPNTTTSATDPATSGTTTTTETTMATLPTSGATGTTTGTTTGPTTGASTGTTDTGDVPTCSMYTTEGPCEEVEGCFWFVEFGQCIVDCAPIKEMATCNMQDYCVWIDDQCVLAIV